jgi:glycosyltransferase involved in cell wall biosynthesis
VAISVVIPTLNEAKNLPEVLPRLPAMVDEVIIVDGRSHDDTVDVARRLLPDCVIVLEPRRGKGAALRAGFAAASGDIIVMMDADGSTDPAEIPGFVGALLSGADFAKGSRFMQGGGTADMEWHRRAGNWVLTKAVNLLFGARFSDLCYGYNAFWRRALAVMDHATDGFEVETSMNIRAVRASLSVTEVASFEHSRIHGTSNLNAFRDGLRIARIIAAEIVRSRPVVTDTPRLGWGVAQPQPEGSRA